jgi:hypothetical protein
MVFYHYYEYFYELKNFIHPICELNLDNSNPLNTFLVKNKNFLL